MNTARTITKARFTKLTTANVTNVVGERMSVKVGDFVGFKSDHEQYGKISEIRRQLDWPHRIDLVLVNPNGFGGEYLRYATTTQQRADDCWID